MKIIIIGDGKIGFSLAENLSKEDNDVTIIDKDPEALKKADEYLDVKCIPGNGVSAKILEEAGIKNTNLLIAATASDEINMVCCLTGKKLGADYTIARIRDPEYADELTLLKKELGLDLVINPERAAAREIARMLRLPQAMHVEVFAKGRVELVEVRITGNMPIIDMKLKDISAKISSSILIGAILRDGKAIIPKGDTEIKSGDIVYVVGTPGNVSEFLGRIGIINHEVKNVMIVGGGRIAYYLANILEETGMRVKIIENDYSRCIALTELLPNTLIINGDGSDEAVLASENLSGMEAFVSLTGRDEENFMSALLAKQAGVSKVVAKINRTNYLNLIKSMGIDGIINPNQITTNLILRYVRGLKNALGNTIETLYKIIGGQVEAIEFTATKSTHFLDRPLRDLRLVNDVLVAAIVRKNDIIIPHGNDVVKLGDSVILIAKDRTISDLNDIISVLRKIIQ
jgi:trk system potassium uptake protein TrkA